MRSAVCGVRCAVCAVCADLSLPAVYLDAWALFELPAAQSQAPLPRSISPPKSAIIIIDDLSTYIQHLPTYHTEVHTACSLAALRS